MPRRPGSQRGCGRWPASPAFRAAARRMAPAHRHARRRHNPGCAENHRRCAGAPALARSLSLRPARRHSSLRRGWRRLACRRPGRRRAAAGGRRSLASADAVGWRGGGSGGRVEQRDAAATRHDRRGHVPRLGRSRLMDTFVATALVGTAQAGMREAATGTPVDALAAALAAGDTERRLLLQAGARAVYQRAGYMPPRVAALPTPAPHELLPACSPAAALLLAPLLAGLYDDLLPAALERLRQAGLRLPYDLLPAALCLRTNALRALVAPLLGERGRWLAGFNPAWSWVGQTLGDVTDDVPADAETIWNEGSAGQRVAVLRRLRAVDVAKAREWVAAVWKSEKAEMRAEMLKASEIGLGAEDEPLLESALDDLAAAVRAAAPTLLARLPGSAFSGRMRDRGDAMLLWNDGNLDTRPPKALDPAALRDGIAEQERQAKGARADSLMQTVAPGTA